jgi:hypothetical protein
MKAYRIGRAVVFPDAASRCWEERRDFDGHNFVGRSSHDQWTYEQLYQSQRGRFYLVRDIHREGSRPQAEFVGPEEAARWLLVNEYPLPECLRKVAESVSE